MIGGRGKACKQKNITSILLIALIFIFTLAAQKGSASTIGNNRNSNNGSQGVTKIDVLEAIASNSIAEKAEETEDKYIIVPNNENDRYTFFDITHDISMGIPSVFEVSGFPWLESNKALCRLDLKNISNLSSGIKNLSWNTAGGVIRFVSNSSSIAIKVELRSNQDMSHMPRSGSSGIDIYMGSGEDKKFVKTAMPEKGQIKYEAVFEGINSKNELIEWTLNLPLYNGVIKLEIGLLPGSKLAEPPKYSIEKPIVFYGSSITQGGCASRPGNSYTHILCRWLDANMVNLGFSGSAKGETEMTEMISQIEMSAFVMDYDYNAPDAEHLRKTHESFFKTIRKAQPNLPVIFISRPNFETDPDLNNIRRSVIYQTYKNAVDGGDENVYFIDGETLFGTEDRDACTVDGIHPNDLGFMRMAETIYPVLKEALGK